MTDENRTVFKYSMYAAVINSFGTLLLCSGDGGTFLAATGVGLTLFPMYALTYYFSYRFIESVSS